ALPNWTLGNDTFILLGNDYELKTGLSGYQHLWNNQATGATISVNKEGSYTVRVTDGYCVDYDTTYVKFRPLLMINLGKDTSLCDGDTLHLKPATNATLFSWNDGDTTLTKSIVKAGTYTIQVSDSFFTNTDTIAVTFTPKPQFSL